MTQPPTASEPPASRPGKRRAGHFNPASGYAAPRLVAAGVAAQRGERPLFRDLHLMLQPGQLVWLRGRTGSGKTSLLRLLAGLGRPAHGTLMCEGEPLRDASPQWRRRMIYIAHADALKEEMTVAECLRFSAALQGRSASRKEIAAALAQWQIDALHDTPVRALSHGQRRRAALARLALPHEPSVWLLDEPFDALDDHGERRLAELFSTRLQRGWSVMFTCQQALVLRDPVPRTLNLDEHAIAA